MVENEVIGVNAFRKKSLLLQNPNPTFIEEEISIVENKNQIIEVFLKKKDFISPNENLLKFNDLPIMVESKKAMIRELEKPVKGKFEGRRSVNYGPQKPIKVA